MILVAPSLTTQPPTLVTNFITENGIIETSGAYRIVSY